MPAGAVDINSLDLEAFDMNKVSYAPKHKQPEKEKEFRILEKGSRIKSVEHSEAQVRSAAILIVTVAVAVFILLGSVLFFKISVTDLSVKLHERQEVLSAAQSEYAGLQMKYNAMLTTEEIERIAEDELGMVKKDNCQVRYFDVSGKDGYAGK